MLDPHRQAAVTQDICKRLSAVIDPELGRNVIEMGLIYLVEVGMDGRAEIMMTTTVQGCPAAGFLSEGVRLAASDADGVTEVKVTLTYEPRWDPRMMASA